MTNDSISGHLEQLPPLAPDAARALRVAAKCRGRIVRHRRPARTPARSRRVEFALIGVFSVTYFTAVALEALRTLRLF